MGLGRVTTMEPQPTADPSAVRLLLIEDDPQVVEAVREGLPGGAFTFEHAASVAEGRSCLGRQTFDILVLDLNLPDGSGLAIADDLRAAGRELPILMLTARSAVDERVDGFRHGADDYLVKPFAMPELRARIDALLRRARPARRHTMTYADVELDLVRRVVRRGEIEAALSAREMDLLVHFMRHAEEVLTRSGLLQEIWGADTEDDSNVLNVYVNYLRNKLEGGLYSRLLHTVRGRGFMLCVTPPAEAT